MIDAVRDTCGSVSDLRELFLIDYREPLHSTAPRAGSRQEIAEISIGINALAKELEVPVIELSHLNRRAAKRKNCKPPRSDLRESGPIEQDPELMVSYTSQARMMMKSQRATRRPNKQLRSVCSSRRNAMRRPASFSDSLEFLHAV